MPRNNRVVLAILIFIVSFFLAGHKSALAGPKPMGITVSPAFQQVIIAAGETKQPVTFSITNDKDVPQTVSLSAADFNTLNESGGLFFVGINPTALQKKYGLAEWFSFPQSEITIGPKQTQIINANILNLSNMSGGGHYGALMIRIAGSGVERINGNNVAIDPIASSLMFVTKMGGDTHNLSLASVDFNHSIFKVPKSVNLKFKNTGNSHVVPRGIVKIVSPSGELISQGTINQNSGIILPESSRVYAVTMRELMPASTPGKYKLYVDFRFDGVDQPRGYQSSFRYVPIVWLFAFAAVMILVAGIGVYIIRRLKVTRKQ